VALADQAAAVQVPGEDGGGDEGGGEDGGGEDGGVTGAPLANATV